MPPPWVQFDSAAAVGGDCTNNSEPDIAGVGVRPLPTPFSHSPLPTPLSHPLPTNPPPGRPLLRPRLRHGNRSLDPRHAARPSLLPQRPLRLPPSMAIYQGEVVGNRVEAGLCVEAFFGSVDYWVGGSAVGYGVCGAFEWVDKGS